MGKPEIIGYQTDHERMWSTLPMPNLTYDSEGVYVSDTKIGFGGMSCEHRRYLDADEFDALMRHHGMKRVYKPREFHAAWRHGGYRLICRTCGTEYKTALPPHDASKLHAERNHHYSTSWADLVE
jgi:hypothetical protein